MVGGWEGMRLDSCEIWQGLSQVMAKAVSRRWSRPTCRMPRNDYETGLGLSSDDKALGAVLLCKYVFDSDHG